MHAGRSFALALSTLAVAGCGRTSPGGGTEVEAAQDPPRRSTAPPRVPDAPFRVEPWLSGLSAPLAMAWAPRDPERRLFIAEKTGKVRVVRDGKVAEAPLLDLSSQVSRGSEQGLLGLAMHPRFVDNGRFYVDYTDREGDTRVVEYRVGRGAQAADPASARQLLFLDQPYANHNGGHLLFGPDGKLWIGTGDGGAANDPLGAGQNPRLLLGKMLRLDVDAGEPFPEVVMRGLRNPWRYTFDRATGDLYVGDVGQNAWEEIDLLPAGSIEGANLGWAVVEGMGHCVGAPTCKTDGLVPPVAEYGHDVGCSVTGGYVYRGSRVPGLVGWYLYTDFCSGKMWGFRPDSGRAVDGREWPIGGDPRKSLKAPASFAEDEDGELYVLSLDGIVYRILPP